MADLPGLYTVCVGTRKFTNHTYLEAVQRMEALFETGSTKVTIQRQD